jgi:PIN domain nuclease of toxin-antitoxin system
VLVDTQSWRWIHPAPERFSEKTRRLVRRPETDLLLSAASIGEIAILHGLGKLRLPEPVERWIPSRIQIGQASVLAIEAQHALRVASFGPSTTTRSTG